MRSCRRQCANALTCVNVPRSRFALCAKRPAQNGARSRALTHALINL